MSAAFLITGGAIAAAGISLLAQTGPSGQTALAEAPKAAPVPSIVEGGGVTLRSVSVNFPGSNIAFPGGSKAYVINDDCLLCHSAGMALNQADLSQTAWHHVVEEMRNAFKAPIAEEDVPTIVDYLVNLKEIMSRPPEHPPDPQHGAEIAAQGTSAGAVACAQCHAFNGVSDSSGAFPRIAGQSAYYLSKQLHDFASGIRSNAIMTQIAKKLTDDDIADVTAYFAGVNGPFLPLKAPDPALVKLGETLASVGNDQRQIQSCNDCHGPEGAGESPATPYLAGQYSNYIAFTLREWQRSFRRSSANVMGEVAGHLDIQDIAALAAYFQQLRSNPQVGDAATEGQNR